MVRTRSAFLVLGWTALLGLALGTRTAQAELSKHFNAQTMLRIDEMQPGMEGICRTVFRGTTPEDFHVQVVKVLRRYQGPSSLVLFRVTDGPLVERHSCVARGMSGSPIYIGGKLAGAASTAVAVTKEPLAAFTPIEDMLECFDEMDRNPVVAPAKTTAIVPLGEPIYVDGTPRDVAVVCPSADCVPSELRDRCLALVPCEAPITVSGISGAALDVLKAAVGPLGLHVAAEGLSGKSDAAPYDIVPGSACSVALMSGDFNADIGGTVTYVEGDRFLAFGHPMFTAGAIDLPMGYSDVADFVVQEGDLADKIMLPMEAPPWGVALQDRPHAVGGRIGAPATTFPLEVTVDYPARNLSRSYHLRIGRHTTYTPIMAAVAGMTALDEWVMTDGNFVIHGDYEFTSSSGKTVHLAPYMYTKSGPPRGVPMEILQAVSLLTENEFSPEQIASAKLAYRIEERKGGAELQRLELDDWAVEPGTTVKVRVVYRLSDGEGEKTDTLEIPIPADHPSGLTALQVTSASTALTAAAQAGWAPAQPTDLQGLLALFQDVSAPANRLTAVMVEPGQTFLSGGVRYPSIPADIAKVLTAAGTTDYAESAQIARVERDTDYEISGVLTHPLMIVRPEDRYAQKAAPAPAEGRPSPGGHPGAPPPRTREAPPRVTASSVWARYTRLSPQLADACRSLGVDVDAERAAFPANPSGLASIEWKLLAEWFGGPPPPGIHMPPDAEPGSVKPKRPGKGEQAAPGPERQGPGGAPPHKGSQPSEGGKPGEGEKSGKPEALPVRGASTWTQSKADDLAKGVLDGTILLGTGGIGVAAKAQTVLSLCPPALYAWALVPDGAGGAYIGTGPDGTVYHLAQSGECKAFFRTGDKQVFSLARLADGTLLAGTGPGGQVCAVDPSGKEIGRVSTGENYVWKLLPTEGSVLAATGPHGRVLRLTRDGVAEIVAHVRDDHVLAIARNGDAGICFGTDTGAVYSAEAGGTPRELGVSPVGAIFGIVAGPDGTLYVASGGNIYRVGPNGSLTTCVETPEEDSFAIAATAGKVFLGTSAASRVYSVDKSNNLSTFGVVEHAEGRLTALVADGGGEFLWALSTDPVAVYKLPVASAPAGTYTSSVFDAEMHATWEKAAWFGRAPEGATVKLETRSGNGPVPNEAWSPWSEAVGDGEWLTAATAPARFLQYRLTMSASSAEAAPVVTSVECRYIAENRAPTVTCDDAPKVRYVGAKAELSWDGHDPDDDALRYSLYTSSDRGLTWELVKGDLAETKYEWETADREEGVYLLKIVVSDETANPGRGKEASIVIGPVHVDRTAPKILVGRSSVVVGEDSVQVLCSASDKGTGIKLAQYRLDSEDPWHPIAPQDLDYGGDYEVLQFGLSGVKAGEHTVEIAVFDRAGNVSVEPLKFTIGTAKDKGSTDAAQQGTADEGGDGEG